jgi:hypothetical protein
MSMREIPIAGAVGGLRTATMTTLVGSGVEVAGVDRRAGDAPLADDTIVAEVTDEVQVKEAHEPGGRVLAKPIMGRVDNRLRRMSMSSSKLTARLLGGLLFVSGAGILLNGDGYRATAEEFLRGVGLIYMSGIMALLGGLAVVNIHNVWTRDWRLLVTLIGWFAVIDGTLRVAVPQFIARFDAWYLGQPGFLVGSAVVVLALGAFLCFKGYSPDRSPALR